MQPGRSHFKLSGIATFACQPGSIISPSTSALVYSPPSGKSAVPQVVACTLRFRLADSLSHFNGKCATSAKMMLHTSYLIRTFYPSSTSRPNPNPQGTNKWKIISPNSVVSRVLRESYSLFNPAHSYPGGHTSLID